ncbi:hypothetical protein GOBAR_AA23530 [Gossypium barbadense]|uniref:tRNA(Ile)-lysidine synthetase n=1 Tax=Gossypium barbadense TaxID=3634 RepID=A0A2P5X1C5_GOSBA|nr:hypothetical protein GOBAR_AA23530 [Gossypium barbadense]
MSNTGSARRSASIVQMARGLVLCSQTRTIAKLSFFLSYPKLWFKPHRHHRPCYGPHNIPSARVFCHCVNSQTLNLVDMAKYNEAFSRRMAMAGIKHHNSIALGVSGGPDSMALCVLAASWKTEGLYGVDNSGKFIDGLLAIIVDHGLRSESKDEASLVGNRVSEIGIRCKIVRCDWLNGKPKQGHLQESARDMSAFIFEQGCFIVYSYGWAWYKIFQDVCMQNQISVLLVAHHADDQAELFILRSSRDSGVLGLAGMAFTSQVFSSHTNFCNNDWKNHSVLLVRPLLDFSKEDMYKICQGSNRDWVEDPTNRSPLFARNRIRASLGNLLSVCFTKAEANQRQYFKITVAIHTYHPMQESFRTFSNVEEKHCFSDELEQIIANGRSYSNNNLVTDSSQAQFLDMRSQSVLDEARRLDVISESTYRNIISLQREEVSHFKSKTDEVASGCESKQGTEHIAAFLSEPLLPGQTCYFMNRFIISWKLSKEISSNWFRGEPLSLSYLQGDCHCCCVNEDEMVAKVRTMIDADWLYLAELTKWPHSDNFEATRLPLTGKITCLDYSRLSAKVALKSLKSIPVAARKSMPLLVDDHGRLLSIPSIGFKHCPCMKASSVFKPRVPLGGGHSSFL